MDAIHTIMDSTNESTSNAFLKPISREQMRADIVTVYVHLLRMVGRLTNENDLSRVFGVPAERVWLVLDGSMSADEIGLGYENVEETLLARAMETLYDYAYFGVQDVSKEPFLDESIYTWVAAFLLDVAGSGFAHEYAAYGSEAHVVARRLADIAELANARHILEGADDNFWHFWNPGFENNATEVGALTVRQMSLLSGMEEMSIRAAANPKRASRLEPMPTERRTLFTRDVAKTWLKAKDRYIPITTTASLGNVDLSARRFATTTDLLETLIARVYGLGDGESIDPALTSRLEQIGAKPQSNQLRPFFLDLEPGDFRDERLMRDLAEVLQLPADLLVARARESALLEELAAVESAVRDLTARQQA